MSLTSDTAHPPPGRGCRASPTHRFGRVRRPGPTWVVVEEDGPASALLPRGPPAASDLHE